MEELIIKCNGENGARFRWLKNCKTYWLAQARPKHNKIMPKDIVAKGKTPKEALENLVKLLNI